MKIELCKVVKAESLTKQLQKGQEGGRASSSRLMSLVTFTPPAHINTPLTEADKTEAMDKSGQSRLSEGDWGHSESATDHSVSSISQWLTAPFNGFDEKKTLNKHKIAQGVIIRA